MPSLSNQEIATLLHPYLLPNYQLAPDLPARLAQYLELLLKWNARTNLTAIRDPEEIVRRHFGESLFAGQHLDPATSTLLDFGSGAGFPGLPIAILRPDIAVTLAESQNKKATFLREAVRTLGLSTEIWSNRVEAMPESRQFHTVALRAVDNMAAAIAAAHPRAAHNLLLLTSSAPNLPPSFTPHSPIPLPNSTSAFLFLASRTLS